MSKETKPEIAYDWKSGQFTKDNQTISYEEARERWDAFDSDWTVGAYNQMLNTVLNPNDIPKDERIIGGARRGGRGRRMLKKLLTRKEESTHD